MIKRFAHYGAALLLLLVSCKGEVKQSDQQTIEENVKSYLFLSDSVDVSVVVTDTLHTDDLQEMLDAVNQNLNLVDNDLDTVSKLIDVKAYQKLEYEKQMQSAVLLKKQRYKDSILYAEKRMLEYQLKQEQLKGIKLSYKQTNRILLHLQRSIWADVAGYDVSVSYNADNAEINLDLLLDAEMRVID